MVLSKDGERVLDTVVAPEVIMDAEALGASLGAPVEDKEGHRAVRIDLGRMRDPPVFQPRETDLRRFDQLVITFRTEGCALRPILTVHLDRRTPGFNKDDYFRSSLSGQQEYVSFPTWGDYLFPYENFLVYGLGEPFYPMAAISLDLLPPGEEKAEGIVWISELRGERRHRAHGPRLTDEGLLGVLEIEGVTDIPGVIRHFKARKAPVTFHSQLPDVPQDWTPLVADQMCQNIILGNFVGDPINWRANPNGYLEWMHAFNRHAWFKELLIAYRATGEPKYVEKLGEIWLSWLRANPEPVGHNGGGDPAWETLSTAVRMYGSWLNAWFSLLQDPHFPDSTRTEILKSFYGHAEHLLRNKGAPQNFIVVESSVVYMVGALFPEFKRSGVWREEGDRRLAAELERQVFPDGTDFELAPGYHMMAGRQFVEAYQVASLNNLSFPPVFSQRLPRTFEYIAGVMRPDGTLPSINDSQGYRSRSGKDYLDLGARVFGRRDLAEGPQGTYEGASRCFPDSGQYILSSGKGGDALWLLFDCGDVGASHRHDDALNIEVFAYGYPFIVDPGISSYLDDPLPHYYRSTFSHNTVLVNGAGQVASRRRRPYYTESVRGKVENAFGEVADFVRAKYESGYEGLPPGVVHKRAVLFVRGAYWVIYDEVSGPELREMEARFQFVPLRLHLDPAAGVFRTYRQGLPSRPNLELFVVSPQEGVTLSIGMGETDPVGGWVADGEDIPAPQARIRLVGDVLRLVTLIYPYREGVTSGISIRELTGLPQGVHGLQLMRGGEHMEQLYYSWDGTAMEIEGIIVSSPVALTTGQKRLYVEGSRWI